VERSLALPDAPLFVVYNHHVAGCGTPPAIDDRADDESPIAPTSRTNMESVAAPLPPPMRGW
jgi:hypothetical protein